MTTAHRTLAVREKRSSQNGQEMLDAYLDGFTFHELGVVFEINLTTARSVVLNAALNRVMRMQSADVPEQTDLYTGPSGLHRLAGTLSALG